MQRAFPQPQSKSIQRCPNSSHTMHSIKFRKVVKPLLTLNKTETKLQDNSTFYTPQASHLFLLLP